MNKTIYRHYGCDHFDKNTFEIIKNRVGWNKPSGGLWASAINSGFGWKDWCESEEFKLDSFDRYFDFVLKDNTKILRFKLLKDWLNFKRNNSDFIVNKSEYFGKESVYLNFEKISEKYDAIEIYAGSDKHLYFDFYGWDCDSIVVLNPDKIVEVNK